jgi:hypothetical protein
MGSDQSHPQQNQGPSGSMTTGDLSLFSSTLRGVSVNASEMLSPRQESVCSGKKPSWKTRVVLESPLYYLTKIMQILRFPTYLIPLTSPLENLQRKAKLPNIVLHLRGCLKGLSAPLIILLTKNRVKATLHAGSEVENQPWLWLAKRIPSPQSKRIQVPTDDIFFW